MKQKDKKELSKKITAEDLYPLIILCLCVTAVFFIIHTFTGAWFWKSQPYNSYVLQAQSWLKGRLDLEQNYSHLEIAVLNGKYYISFPPFPSYVMLPFVLLGWTSCDGIIAFITSLSGAVYAFKILDFMKIKKEYSVFFALFLTIASNWLMTAQNAWVWFIAQNMAFTLSLAAIYYAMKNKAGLSLALWACAVGCRPFQALYIPVLLYLIYNAHKAENPDDKILDMVKKRFTALIPMIVIALSYMILNFARFGNPLEFGHNYLPEFVEAEKGQFDLSYIRENLPAIFRLPPVGKNGRLNYPMFNGMCIFMISPIFISYVVYNFSALVNKYKTDKTLIAIIFAVIVVEILTITAHKTMGGSHFGNRYTNDVLPLVLLGNALILKHSSNKYFSLNYPIFFMGLALNILGTTFYFLQ